MAVNLIFAYKLRLKNKLIDINNYSELNKTTEILNAENSVQLI
jgi:hypothetical protein